jgi:AcrR family transcriptional regulator
VAANVPDDRVTRSGAGDPARTLALLWRQSSAGTRGPKPGLNVDRVVDAAISLADGEGIAALTMRRVAQALGVAPMSLYTYVPGKAELVDLMLDRVYAQMPRAQPAAEDWRDRVTAVAEDNRRLYQQHPWVAMVSTTRPALGPGQMAKYEYELRALDGIGLGDVAMDAALTFVLGFVLTCARASLDARAIQLESAMSDAEWWAAHEPLLARVLDASAYPVASRVGSAAGEAYGGAYNAQYAYEFGLARVLDGIAALLPLPPSR